MEIKKMYTRWDYELCDVVRHYDKSAVDETYVLSDGEWLELYSGLNRTDMVRSAIARYKNQQAVAKIRSDLNA